jgi:Uma2 family endonuclease
VSSPNRYEDITFVPRVGIVLPLELPAPEGFVPDRVETWPVVQGRLEYVQGRLLFMPPCGDDQQKTVADITTEVCSWGRARAGFDVGTNEAGMVLGGEVRGADVAVWRSAEAGPGTGGFLRVPPVLAVEVTGKDESVGDLLEKARWYLDRGVQVVWIADPRARVVRIVTRDGDTEVGKGERLPAHAALPGLQPRVDDLFLQVDRAGSR